MGKKVKTFFSVFVDSLIPQPREYRSFLHRRLLFSSVYFTVYVLILSSVLFLIYFFRIQPFSLVSDVSRALRSYPDDLVVAVKDGVVSKNYDRPYFMWLEHNQKKTLLFLVEEQYANQRMFDELKPTFFLTQHMLAYRLNPTSGIYTLTNKHNVSLTKEWFQKLERIIVPVLYLGIPILSFVFFLFILFLISVSGVIIISLLSFGGCLLLHRLGHKHRFTKILQVGIHSSTLPLLLTAVFMTIQPKLSIPFGLLSALCLIFIATAIYEVLVYRKTLLSKKL